MKTKGFCLSLEAIMSLAFLGLLLSIPVPENSQSLNELHVFKKANDLLIIWAADFENLNREKIIQDFEKAFPGKSGEIFFGAERIVAGNPKGEAVSSQAVFFVSSLERKEIRLVVYKGYFS